MSFSIATGKEGVSPKRPLFLVTVTASDGDICYLTTAAYYGAPNITWNGNTYLARIQKNEIQAIQAMSPQGYDSVPAFTMTLADADYSIWSNHCAPHGWRGATVTITVLLWDVVANQYSTDALQWSFLGGNPQHDHSNGQTTLDVVALTNFSRMKIPSVAIEYRCPWAFPTNATQRAAALNDPTSIYYQCGYSADQTGGCGNKYTGTNPYTNSFGDVITDASGNYITCDYVRSSSADPTVGCMARMGNAATTSVAPDGDLEHDKSGNYTARFGGVSLVMPAQYSGRQYVSGQKTFGFNQPNTAIVGSYYNLVYGTQWVQGQVLAPAGDPNSLRTEVAVCLALFGACTIWQVLVNGVLVPRDNSDPLFTWRFAGGPGSTQGSGGRSGKLNGDKYYSDSSHAALGDPHGSLCVIEVVVPAELAQPGSVPDVKVLVTSGPLVNCYPIASASGSGGTITITFPAGVPDLNLGVGAQVFIAGNSWSVANGAATVATATYGPPGVLTLSTTGTGSGTGGGVFFYHQPDLSDSGYNISTQDSTTNGPAANPVWVVLDLMLWGNITASQIDALSFYNAAQVCATQINYVGADGNTYTHAQFKTCAQFPGNSRQALSSVLTALRNSANLLVAPNSSNGLIQCFVKQGLYNQQPAVITGSNDTTARNSWKASDTSSATGTGYFAYLFDETNIDKDSFKITTTRVESTPNTVAFSFQDEYNSYQTDSMTEVDPQAYLCSGNQEVNVTVPVAGIANFDHATRFANVQIAEPLYGNPRNDAGGTQYFEFRTNHRVLHLAGRLGYICGLRWRSANIGISAPQPVRILSLKPDTDGEHWQVRCAWHNDQWYTYLYGQNPTPFQRNPLLLSPTRPPYPWRPGVTAWGSSDPIFPGKMSFGFAVDTSAYPAQISITGNVPVNVQPAGVAPVVPLQATTANTGGAIKPGTYHIAFSTNGVSGPTSSFVTCTVPSGTNTNTITVAGLRWQSGAAPAIQPYIGWSSMSMRAAASGSYSSSTPDSNGNPTIYTFTSISPDGLGLPDINFSEFLVEETGIVHGGVWGDVVTSAASNVLSFPEVSWAANQWAGYVLSLYYRPGVTTQPALNIAVSSSTTNTLTMASTGFLAGDVVVLRAKASSITSNTIGDPNFQNWYNGGSGLTVNAEAGNLIQIIGGTGAWQPAKTIASNTATVFTIQGTWDVTPDSTSVYIILSPTLSYSYTTQAFTSTGSGVVPIASTSGLRIQAQSVLVQVAAADSAGNTSPMQYQPFREVYIPRQTAITVSANANITLTPVEQNVQADASGGAFTITLPAFGQWLGLDITIAKVDSGTNAVTWQLASGDSLPGIGTTGTITTQGSSITITATQA